VVPLQFSPPGYTYALAGAAIVALALAGVVYRHREQHIAVVLGALLVATAA
jgi:hypothetical protein